MNVSKVPETMVVETHNLSLPKILRFTNGIEMKIHS